ncbi:MAG: PIN domain-containing protein [Bacteroidia bacterium]|nr:PIN domain-containing protein [Bacteroidia bacterium]
MSNVALDSNIVLYALDKEQSERKMRSLELILPNPFISSQVLSEVINVCRKRWKFDKEKLIGISTFLLNNCQIIPVTADVVQTAHTLIKKYQFQYFDALIVASALDANCNVLYSEDMQHGLSVNDSLRIINPFI